MKNDISIGGLMATIRELMVAIEYMRRACEHAEGKRKNDDIMLSRARSVGIRVNAKHKTLLQGYQRQSFWNEVDEIPRALGLGPVLLPKVREKQELIDQIKPQSEQEQQDGATAQIGEDHPVTIHQIDCEVEGSHEHQFITMANGKVVGRVGVKAKGLIVATMRQLFVVEEERGKGIGKRLVRECVDAAWYSGCMTLNLTVALCNRKVIPFYQRLGFIVAVEYEDQEIVMVRPLNRSPQTVDIQQTVEQQDGGEEFRININYDPDENYEPEWRVMSKETYLKEWGIYEEAWQEMIQEGAVLPLKLEQTNTNYGSN